MIHRITLLAFDDCLASAVIGALDLFHAANVISPRMQSGGGASFATQVVSPDGEMVTAAGGYRIEVDGGLVQATPPQVIMVPGISLIEPDELLCALDRYRSVVSWLRDQHQQGAWIVGGCSGTFLLAEADLLNGQPAATTNWFVELFQQRYPAARLETNAAIVLAERVVTAGGAMSYIDLALHVVEILAGRELARTCARYVVLDNRRGPRAPALIRHHAQTYDPLIAKAEKWMRAHLRGDIRVEDVAAHVAVSARTLIRRFKDRTGDSPQLFLQKLRLEAGKALLANTNFRLDQILERVGYSDDSAFRRLFKKHTNLSPSEYRRRFGTKAATGVE